MSFSNDKTSIETFPNNKLANSYECYQQIPLNNHNTITLQNNNQFSENIINPYKNKTIQNIRINFYPKRITKKIILEKENEFNPITQKYLDTSLQKNIENHEKQIMINHIKNAYEKEIDSECSYDIIKLKDKHSPYKKNNFNYLSPNISHKIKNLNYNTELKNQKPYNILSNLPLKLHHFLPPEKRDNLPDIEGNNEGGIIPIKNKKILFNDIKIPIIDYNIINNEYFEFNDEKTKVDKEIQRLNLAKQYNNLKTYDIIKGKFANADLDKKNNSKTVDNPRSTKETEYIKKKQKILLNPINYKISDFDEQKKLDKNEYNKKERFRMKEIIDNYNREKNTNDQILSEERIKNRFCSLEKNKKDNINQYIFNRNKRVIQDHIQTEPNTGYRNEDKILTKWKKIMKYSDQNNNNFNEKPVYEFGVDQNDIDERYEKCMNQREKILKNNPIKLKIKLEKNINNNNVTKVNNSINLIRNIPLHKVQINKAKFFGS